MKPLFVLRALTAVIALIWAMTVQALPVSTPVPGGVVVLTLPETDQQPSVTYHGKRVAVIRNSGQWFAVVGIPLAAPPGDHQIEILQGKQNKHVQHFTVLAKEYEKQYITIKDKRKVEPNTDDLKRISLEKKIITEAFAHWSDNPGMDLDLQVPVEGRLSSPFGLKRFFNQQPRNPHSGLDIAADKGTPIRAPANAVVLNTGNYFFNGNTVFLDHGQGFITMYCHMDVISVKPGERLQRGNTIGTIGMTGRVTGPHLHWSVSLNNTRVDPALFLPPQAPSEPAPTAEQSD
jgi:murein DD-endopeptidase MepM/ murein hydrolase activator NlpD